MGRQRMASILMWDVDAWLSDPAVWLLRSPSRDCLFTMLCSMKKFGDTGEVSGTLDDFSTMCRVTENEVKMALEDIEVRGAAEVHTCNGRVTVLSRRMKRDYERRLKSRNRVSKHRVRSSSNATGNAPVTGVKRFCNSESPLPLVSPLPITLSSSLPLPLIYSPLNAGERAEVTEDHRQQAVQGFDQWSNVMRGYPLVAHENEHRHVFELLEVLIQMPPVIDGARSIGQHNLVAQVCEVLLKRRAEFKSVKYACACVRGELDGWKRNGLPGAAAAKDTPEAQAKRVGELIRQREAARAAKGTVSK